MTVKVLQSVINYDPWAINDKTINEICNIQGEFDVVYCCNVLNVVEDVNAVLDQLRVINSDYFIIQIYEGNRSGVGVITRDGFQQNRKTKDYLPFLNTPFAWSKSNIIFADGGL